MFPAGLGRDLHVLYALYAGISRRHHSRRHARIVAAWFPDERTWYCPAIFNSAQIFLAGALSPLLGWLTFAWGWERLHRYGVDWFCADGAVDQVDS